MPSSFFLFYRPTTNHYKLYVIVQLDLPEKMADFGDKLRENLEHHIALGGQLDAELDNGFYFKRVRGKFD